MKVLVYDAKENEINAVRNCHIFNNTGMVLAPGNITVLDNGKFAGQSPFAPMLPGDDQLIPYGEDSTVGIQRTKPKSRQKKELDTVTPIFDTKTGLLNGVKLTYKCKGVTVYTVKNNAVSKDQTIDHFYIDHCASPAHNGYTVVTKDKCVKSVMGFSRFDLALKPQENVEFVVEEEAAYEEVITRHEKILSFMDEIEKVCPPANKKLSEELSKSLNTLIHANIADRMLKAVLRSTTALQCVQLLNPGVSKRKTVLEAFQFLRNCSQDVEFKYGDMLLGPNSFCQTLQSHLEHEKSIKQAIDSKNKGMQLTFQNQDRLRQNLKSLEHHGKSALVKRYLSDMSREEDDLIKKRQEIEDLEVQRNKNTVSTNAVLSDVKKHAVEATEQLKALKLSKKLA